MLKPRPAAAFLFTLFCLLGLARVSAVAAQDAAGDDGDIVTAQATAAQSTEAQPPEAKAQPTAAKPVSPAREPKATPATPTVRPLSVVVELVSKNTIDGTLTDTTELQMQTSFGTASIPLSEVAGIRFASANDATTTIVMLNGDSITGATDVKLITVETEWGTASINGPSIASIMFVPGLKWNPESGLNGKRWSLTDDKTPELKASSPANAGSNSLPPPRAAIPANNQNFQSPGNFPSNSLQPLYPNR